MGISLSPQELYLDKAGKLLDTQGGLIGSW